jgi:nitrate reductase delta subunit
MKNERRIEAMQRVRTWTAERFSLSADAIIAVSERTCSLSGFPPLETHVLFLPLDGKRHHFKLFKPVTEVVVDDLPYAWLKDSLIVVEGAGCDCC